jgi:hypothetical protein
MFTANRSITLFAALGSSFFALSNVWALPSPLDHVHDGDTVDWQRPGSPALPWTNAQANVNNHQHLTSDSFDVADKHAIYGAWDDRTLHYINNLDAPSALDTPFGHGLIRPDQQVRYYADNTIPEAGRTLISSVYSDWVSVAREQFAAKREPWDAIAIGFQAGTAAQHEISLSFVHDLAPYGVFTPGPNTIQFRENPSIRLDTGNENFWIRLGDTGIGNRSIRVDTPWSFDNMPSFVSTDFDYSDDSGNTWYDAPPAAFPTLTWNFGQVIPADRIEIYEMDFATIARHEIGHSIGLDHVLNSAGGNRNGPSDLGPVGNLMRWDIAENAHFGDTLRIDANSALAAAIDYTFSFDPNNIKDFGDAPDSYHTYLASDGPRYQEGELQRLGFRWDAEPDGQPTQLANGDDLNYWGVGGPDDEDGVIFGDSWVDVLIDITRPGFNDYSLRAWWDTNENGIFDHLVELFIDDILSLDAGSYWRHFDLGFNPKDYYSRFRLTWLDDPLGLFGGVSRLTDITPHGEFLSADGLSHGEVEDYVPEPGTFALLGAGALAFRFTLRRKRRPIGCGDNTNPA